MIERKKKICRGCHEPRYIFSHGLCEICYKKASFKPLNRRSPLRRGDVPPKRKSGYIRPRSLKRAEQEKDYKRICAEIDSSAKETGNLECFFCGNKVTRAQHHHLDGRDNSLLTKREWIARVHGKCHRDYHDLPADRVCFEYTIFLMNLKNVSEELYQKEILRLNK